MNHVKVRTSVVLGAAALLCGVVITGPAAAVGGLAGAGESVATATVRADGNGGSAEEPGVPSNDQILWTVEELRRR
ncbi:hypothetical protein ACH429_02600 [Streptomyces pathocidini]|uniref:Uncharacterized protein n=1 Tax=Streptomyces pathocidini TaxID=1650571 RepID=A0ABW7UK21_9ACTN|nr:hypothetical protein [Streptomyces pathocidini]